MKSLSEYITEKQDTAKQYDTKKAKTALEIETAMNNGDFIVTSEMEFDCPKLSDSDLEDLESAIKEYWDGEGIEFLKIERDGDKFKIVKTKTPEEKADEKEDNGKENEQDDSEDASKSGKELIDFFKEQGSEDPERDLEEFIKGMYGDPDDPDFKKLVGSDDTNESVSEGMVNEDSLVTRMLTGSLIRSSIRAKLAKDRMALIQMKIAQEDNPRKIRRLKNAYNLISTSNFDEKGRPRAIVLGVKQMVDGFKDITNTKTKEKSSIGEVIKNCTTLGKIVGAAQVLKARNDYPEAFQKALGRAEEDAGQDTGNDTDFGFDRDEFEKKDREREKGKVDRKKEKEERKRERENNKDKTGVEKDKDGNVLKKEEITDTKGKKISVTTHTGPRGGKFYFPKGSPHNDDHKVYIDKHGKAKVNESISLSEFLVSNA